MSQESSSSSYSCSSCAKTFKNIYRQLKSVKHELIMMFLLITSTTFMNTEDADLQKKTFGKSEAYTIVGVLSAVQGVLCVIYAPIFGTLSDMVGRNIMITISFCCLACPSLIAMITEDYTAYFISKNIFPNYAVGYSVISASLAVSSYHNKKKEQYQDQEENNNNSNDNDIENNTENNNNNNNNGEEEQKNDNLPVTEERLDTYSYLLAVFVVGNTVGSSIGTAIQDVKYKIIGNFIAVMISVIFCIFFGVNASEPTIYEMLTCQKQDNNDDTNNNNINNSQETSSLIRNADIENGENNNNNDDIEVDENETSSKLTLWQRIRKLTKNRDLMLMCLITVCDFMGQQTIQALVFLYANQELNMTDEDLQKLTYVVAVSALVGLLFVTRWMSTHIHLLTAIRIALCATILLLVGTSVIKNKTLFTMTPSLYVFCAVSFPTMSTAASIMVEDEDVGAGLGLLAASRFLAEGIAPALGGVFLQKMENTSFAGAPFASAAGIVLVGVILTYALPDTLGSKKKEE